MTHDPSPSAPRRALRALLAGLALGTPAAAQLSNQHGTDERLMTQVVGQKWVTGQSTADLLALKNSGWRMTTLELQDAREWRFAAALVRNEGPYRRNWWFGTKLTKSGVLDALYQTNSRLIDIEPVLYRDTLYYAAVAVEKQPGDPDSWLVTGKSTAELQAIFVARNARIVDIERYTPPGATGEVFAAIMVQNDGPHHQDWSWILDATTSQLLSALSANNMRSYDLERVHGDRFDCIMVASGLRSMNYALGTSEGSIELLRSYYKLRVIDIGFSPSTGLFDVVMISNSLAGSVTRFGSSCYSSFTATATAPGGEPRIGSTIDFRLKTIVPFTFAGLVTLFVGASRTSWNGVPLPLDLGILGAPGCQLYTSGDLAVPLLANPDVDTTLVVPNQTALVGSRLYAQFLVPFAGFNPAGLVTTNGVAVVIGGDGF